MIKIEKNYGVKEVSDTSTLVRLQELIALSKQQFGWVGKAIIDTEKITFYKFGLKLGICRLATNGLVVNELGIIQDYGMMIPEIIDRQVLTDLCVLFNMKINF